MSLRLRPFLPVLVLLLAAVPTHAATGGTGRGAGARKGGGVTDSTVAASAEGFQVTVGDLLKRSRPLSPRHATHGEEAKEAERAAEEAVREGLILQVIRKSGFDGKFRGPERVIRNRYYAIRYLQDLEKKGRFTPSDEELEARLPRRWVKMKFQELTLPTRNEAEKARAKAVEDPGSYTGMIREESIGPRNLDDGYTGFIEPPPFTAIFTKEQGEQIFPLQEGEFSPVIESGLGFTVYRVVEVVDFTPEEISRRKWRTREGMIRERKNRFQEQRIEEAAPSFLFESDMPKAYRMVLDFFGGAEASKDEVLRAGDLSLSFWDLTQLEKLWKWPKKELDDPVEYTERIKMMVNQYIVPEQALGSAAAKDGFSLKKADAADMERKLGDWLLERFYEEQVEKYTTVSDQEVEDQYQQNREMFRTPLTADIRYLRTESPAKAQEALQRMARERTFDAGWKWAGKGGLGSTGLQKELLRASPESVEDPVVWKIALRLGTGQSSRVIQDGKHHYIVSLDRVHEWREIPFGELQNELKKVLTKRKRAERVRDLFTRHYPDLRIEKNPEAIAYVAEQVRKGRDAGDQPVPKKKPAGHGHP